MLNSVVVRGSTIFAGTLIDDTVDDVVSIEAAGGRMLGSALPGLANAAGLAQALRRRGGDPDQMEAIMNAAVDSEQQAAIVGSDVVDPTTPTNNATTPTNNAAATGATVDSATATNQAAVTGATVDNATPTNQNTTQRVQEVLADLDTAGDAVHAQFAAGAAINAVAGFTLTFPRRTFQFVFGAMSVATVVTVTGTDITGAVTVEGARAFDGLTSVVSDVDPQDVVDMQTGEGFAVGQPMSVLDVLSVDGTVEAANSSHLPTGTIVPTTAPNAARDFAVRYQAEHTHVQNAHNHALTDPTHNHVQDAHGHGVTDPTHNHTQNAHNHTQNAHAHTLS